VVHPGESKREKLERWVIEASKQCGRNVLMEIAPLIDWPSYCDRADLGKARWIAHPAPDATTAPVPGSADSMALAVGPEGGFTKEELELARAAGWQAIHLGPRILRVETAAIALAVLASARR
jgi:16S rRNA (uracil1498-N3)-methyltransferase